MPIDIGSIVASLILKDKFSSEFEKAASKLEKSGKKMESLGRDLSDVGTQLTKTITLPILAIGGASLKMASDFESSFAGVRKTVNATAEEFAALSKGMRELSKEIPVNVNELNKIGEAAGQLGIKTENILAFTEVMANLGVATNLSAEEAATSLARLANITGLAQSDFDRLGSTIVALGNNFATTEAEIVEIGLRIAGAGTQIGLTEGQILALGTALSSVGINAEAGGSAISKVMINMALAVSKGGRGLKQFADVAGLSSAEFSKAFKEDAAGALNEFILGLGKLQESGGDVLSVLDEMGVTEVRMRDALLRAAGAGDLLTRALDLQSTAWEENTALTKEAEQRYATFESQLTLTWNKLRDVGITIGTALLPVMRDMLDALSPLIGILESAALTFADLPSPIQSTVVVLGLLLASIGPVVFVTGQLITSWGVIIARAPSLVIALNTIKLAFLGIATAIGAVLLIALDAAIRKFGEAQEAAMKYEREASKALDITFRLSRARISGDGIISPELFDEATSELKRLQDEIKNVEKAKFNLEQGITLPSLKGRANDVKEVTDKLKDLETRYVLLQKELHKVKGVNEEVADSQEELSSAFGGTNTELEKLLESITELQSLLQPLHDTTVDNTNQWEALQDAVNQTDLDRINKAIELGLNPNLEEAANKINEFAEAHGIAFRTSAEQLQDYVDHNIAVEKSIRDNIEALDDYINKVGEARSLGPEIVAGVNTTTSDDFPFLEDLLAEVDEINLGEIFIDDIQKEFEEFSKKKWKEIWGGMEAVAKRSWENIQDAAADFISTAVREQELSWKSLADSMIDIFSNMLGELLIQWIAYLVKKVAANASADAAITASNAGAQVLGGGAGIGGIGTDFLSIGGGGGGTSAAGGVGLSTLAVAGIVVGIVGVIGYSLGWWGGYEDKVGKGTFGTDPFTGDIAYNTMGERAIDIARKFKEAAKIVTESIDNMGLEIIKLKDVALSKEGKNYSIGGAPISVLGIENTAQAISEAVAVLAIRGAEFGDSVSDLVAAIIHGSEAVTMEALEADVAFARMVEGFGKTEFESEVANIGNEIDAIIDKLVRSLRKNVTQLGVGLDNVITEEISRWEAIYRDIMGIELTPKEQRELLVARGKIFEAEKELRILDIESRIEALKAEIALVDFKHKLGIDELDFRRKLLEREGELYNAQVHIQAGFISSSAQIANVGQTILHAQLKAFEKLLKGLKSIPGIDFTKIKVPKGGVGEGGIDQVAADLERLDSLLRQSYLSSLSPFLQSLEAINDKWDEAEELAHGNAEKLQEINDAREREIAALERQRQLQFDISFNDFVTETQLGLTSLGQSIRDVHLQANQLYKDLGELAEELGLSGQQLYDYFTQITAAEKNRIDAIAKQGLSGLLSGLAGLVQDEELRYQLLMNAAIIEFELKMALYRADYEILKGLGALSAETIAILDTAFDWIGKNKDVILDFQVPRPGTRGGGGRGRDNNNDAQNKLIEATNRLKDILARSLSPFEQSIRSVVDEFAGLREVLGWTTQLQQAYAQELQRVVDAQLDSVRRLRESLDFRQDAPLRTIDQFDKAYERLLSAANSFAGGDLSQIEEIPELAQLVLDLIPSSGASSARRDIFDFVRNLLLDVEDVSLDLVDDIEPGGENDPFAWLREVPTAGDNQVTTAIYDMADILGSKQDDTTAAVDNQSHQYEEFIDNIDNGNRPLNEPFLIQIPSNNEMNTALRRISENTADTVTLLRGNGIRVIV